jgi:hypothetical protein
MEEIAMTTTNEPDETAIVPDEPEPNAAEDTATTPATAAELTEKELEQAAGGTVITPGYFGDYFF